MLTCDPMSTTPDYVLKSFDGWLLCMRAGRQYRAELYDTWDEAIDDYDHGRMGWYATAMYGCRLGMPVAKLTYADIERLRRDV